MTPAEARRPLTERPAAAGSGSESSLRRDLDIAVFAREHVGRRVAVLGSELQRSRAVRDEGAVHDLRVAARRLLATIDCFRMAVWSRDVKALRKRCKSVLEAGRDVRDLDIALALAAAAGARPDSGLCRELRLRRSEAEDGLAALVGRRRFRGFDRTWSRKLASSPLSDRFSSKPSSVLKRPGWIAGMSCTLNAERVLPRMAAAFFAEGRATCAGEPSASDLHRLRLSGKRLRYCLELFLQLYGPPLAGQVRRLKRVQRSLGAVSDCDATDALLRSAGLLPGVEARALSEYLRDRSAASTASFLQRWKGWFDAGGAEGEWVRLLASGVR